MTPLEENCIILIPAGTHFTLSSKLNFDLFNCQFKAQVYQTLDLFEFMNTPPQLKVEKPLLTEELFKQLLKQNGDNLERSAIIQLLICPFLKEVKKSSSALHRLLPIFDYIAENIRYSPKIEDLAKLLQLDKTYFISIFRKIVGVSPGQYIQQEKIKEACVMLQNHHKVSQITQELDFYDTSHFCRIFKKEMNETPKQFLKRMKQEN
ncbi:transcriptional regulator, AraC family protein [Lentisphaera araneosa HTCC2155]|uniref:Transcriptional regulator, AraC family protein n=1 Tax=Lentisphaera araneosa HTCC2155 TaxID=313628 RepID=A6DRX3_9BACT|nr:transcriptional regulator, AraC family protein [Lentisphaera araneosa HTCC2155]